MQRKIVHIAALALLITASAQAEDLGLSGPANGIAGDAGEYVLTFKLSGPNGARNPKSKVRNPAGVWSEETAAMTVTGTTQRTYKVKKTVGFPFSGVWHIRLGAEVWTTPQCRKPPCSGPYHSGNRFGTKDVPITNS